MVLTDAVARMCEGVLPDAVCFEEESHYNGLLEYPQYTRPEVWHEQVVPPVLLSGHHKNIETWRFAASLQETKENVRIFMQSMLTKNREKQLPHFNKL